MFDVQNVSKRTQNVRNWNNSMENLKDPLHLEAYSVVF